MICYRCHKEYDNSGIDKKGFKETKIQKNSSDNNYYCIDCAHENYIDEIITCGHKAAWRTTEQGRRRAIACAKRTPDRCYMLCRA